MCDHNSAEIGVDSEHLEANDVELVAASGLFDRAWYLTQNPDVARAGVDPLLHYLRQGGSEGREPSPGFWSAWYREIFDEVKRTGTNPLVHYLRSVRNRAAQQRGGNPTPATREAGGQGGEAREGETFNMFWHGDTLSAMEAACMRSFVSHGHKVRVFTYRDIRLPEGTVREDAAQILPFDQYFDFMDSPSAFSNIFRYKLLLEQGGWWVDTDVVCLQSDIPACRYFWALQDEYEEVGINGAVLKFPRGDPRCSRLLQLSLERSGGISVWGQLGPKLLTEILANDRPPGLLGATRDAYPIRWVETYFAWLPEFAAAVEARTAGSLFLHLWHRMFGEMGIDINRTPPQGSYVRQLCCDQGQPLPSRSEDPLETRRSIAKYLNRDWNLKHLSECFGKDLTGVIPLYTD